MSKAYVNGYYNTDHNPPTQFCFAASAGRQFAANTSADTAVRIYTGMNEGSRRDGERNKRVLNHAKLPYWGGLKENPQNKEHEDAVGFNLGLRRKESDLNTQNAASRNANWHDSWSLSTPTTFEATTTQPSKAFSNPKCDIASSLKVMDVLARPNLRDFTPPSTLPKLSFMLEATSSNTIHGASTNPTLDLTLAAGPVISAILYALEV
ncbi:hypothetical protein BDN72DRAFT_906541 [Pluteus cervinus]|uniref:Uncharacterized protein n=1 Tax=Pluteus cervinus TaxID=181527 RepID=A0ACD2ZZS7_9AGAR|nr:hypothetical protein BDN72DRAFT_906541 [Pluteus cervinus]